MDRRPELPETLRQALEAEFVEDRAVLAGLFPGSPVLDASYPFLK
jgi:hypothetical protein